MTVKRSYYQSSSFKMAALFTILLGAAAILLGFYLYDFSRQIFIQETEAAIDIEIEHILIAFDGKSRTDRISYIQERASKYANPVYHYHDQNNQFLAGNIPQLPSDITSISVGIIGFYTKIDDEQRQVGAKIHTFEDGSRLLIGRDIDEIIKRYDRLKLFSALILVFLITVVLVSFFISTFVVSRINMIGQTAQNIMATGDLSQRISIDSNWDDLSNLAQILNAMLARIEMLMIGIREVSDNIAHDLRTPLARLRSQLEEGLKQPLNSKQIEDLLYETDQLLGLFKALMRISKIEKQSQPYQLAPTRLSTVIADVIELYEPLAEQKQINLKVDVDKLLPISASSHLLFQMMANIIDNAIKYSPYGGTVLIQLEKNGDRQKITVSDQGHGIPKDQREKVFDRFYRLDRSRHTEGNGLGLSLAKAILAMHDGRIELHDNAPGLRIEIWL